MIRESSRYLIYFTKKCSQKCSHSVDFYCNVLQLTKEKNASYAFFSVLIRIECLLNFGEHNVFAKFW